jgi:amidase
MIHSRRLRAVTTLAALGWVLTTAVPIEAKTITYTPQQVYYTYCFSHPPAARIASGDTVVTKTRDASNDLIQSTDKTTGKLDLSRANPQTGPFFVEGAAPGDTLKVHIDKITLNRNWGWGGAMPYFGALAPEYKTMMITPPVQDTLYVWKLDARRGVAVLDMPKSKIGKVEVPVRPFLGRSAPRHQARSASARWFPARTAPTWISAKLCRAQLCTSPCSNQERCS